MRLRRLAAVPLAAAAVFGTAAAGFAVGTASTSAAGFAAGTASTAAAPQALTGLTSSALTSSALTSSALTSSALSSRYAATAGAIATAAQAARRSGDTQLASALAELHAKQVIFFDPRGQGLAGMVLGNLATARRVAILVPGSDTTLTTFFSRGTASPGGGAAALAAEAGRLDPGARLAIIAWLGYPAPATLSPAVATSGDASAGARALRPLVAALAGRGDQVTLLCHSYGSVVCGLAAPGLPATDIAVFGSPGMDASSVRSLDTTARVWAGRGDGDWIEYVPHVQLLRLGFGADPMSPGFGARIFATGPGGHSDYLRPGSVSLRNLADIALGEPAAVTR
jgi:hypothetical protein